MSQITPQILRVATVLLTLCVATASSADESPASEAAQVAADLDAVIAAQTSSLVEQALNEQMAAVRNRSDAKLAQSIAKRVDVQLAAATDESMSTMLALKERKIERAAKIADRRMESGSITLQQGVAMGRHRFDQPFGEAPKIALGIRLDEDSKSNRPAVALRVVSVDEAGFDYVIRSRESSWSQDLTADWVAFASTATGS